MKLLLIEIRVLQLSTILTVGWIIHVFFFSLLFKSLCFCPLCPCKYKLNAPFCASFRTPCKINPAVNTVLSARKPSRMETPLKRLQDLHQQQKAAESGKQQEQSMYCKELLLSGATEFCFEELRAECYFKRVAQESKEARRDDNHASGRAENWCLWREFYLHHVMTDVFLLSCCKYSLQSVPVM